MNDSVKDAIKTSALGYLLIIASIFLILIIGGLVADYPLARGIFTVELVTFRLAEIHKGMVIAPLLVSAISITLLSKTGLNKRIAAGISLNTYYILTAFLFYFKGTEEFPYEILLIWIPGVFIIGYVSSILAEKFD